MAITQQQYTEAIGRAGLTFADGILYCTGKEAQGCAPNWTKYLCWLKQIKSAQFFASQDDYTSADSVYIYNVIQVISGTNHSDPVLDPTAQPVGGVTIIVDPTTGGQPAITPVVYSDPNWDVNHLVYTNTAWAGFTPQIYVNGQRYLSEGVEFTSTPIGGFILTSPIIDGDVYYITF